MRFYALSTEGIDRTYRALQYHQRKLRGSTGASRCLRVAQLYGHLQFRAREGREVRLVLRDLAAAWHLQPRLLREDLQDLQVMGWLTYSSGIHGTRIQLNDPLLEAATVDKSETAVEILQPVSESPAGAIPGSITADAEPQEMPAEGNGAEPSTEPESIPPQSPLIAQFAATYNQNKPETWPAYTPTGTMLASRLRQAIRHAGGAEAFEAALIRALRGMPEFWRTEYPQERNGADCARALLQVDRASEGRGVEHWHVFAWSAYTGRLCGGIGGNTPGVGHHRPAANYHPDHRHACSLLLWDGHEWKGRGMEAAKLPVSELQRLAEILEAAGFGKPGKAAEQFAQETKR